MIKRLCKHLYRTNRFWRRIALLLRKNKIFGSVQNTTYLSHCYIDCGKNNLVTISPSDFLIRNLNVRITGERNEILIGENFVTEGQLEIHVFGSDNKIELDEYVRVLGCPSKLQILGNHCAIVIGKQCKFDTAFLDCRDDGSKILIGERLDSQHNLLIDSMEGASVKIGNDVLIAYSVEIRNNDGHSILDESNLRINPAQDVFIGNHVWIGADTLILKGAAIPDDCVVAARSIVTKPFVTPGCVLIGAPAQAKKSGIHWVPQRIQNTTEVPHP